MRDLFRWTGGLRWTALAVLAQTGVGLLVLFGPGHLWVGSWKMALDQGTGSALLIAPATSGLAAWTYARMRLLGWDRWSAGVRRGLLGWLTPLAAVTLVGLVATACCTAIAVGMAQLAGSRPAPGVFGMTGQVAAVIGCQATIGAFLGGRFRGVAAAPTAVTVTFLLEALTTPARIAEVFRTGGVTGPLAAETFDFDTLAWESLLLVLITLVMILVLARPVAPQLRRAWTFSVVSGLIAVGAGWLALNDHGYERYRPISGERALTCLGHSPEVCTSVDTVRPLPSLRSGFSAARHALTDAGATLPDRFVQELPGQSLSNAGVIILTSDEVLSSRVSAASIAISLATPHACPAFSRATDPRRALEVKYVLADWIATRNRQRVPVGPPGSPEAVWLARPQREQAPWVRKTYALLSACDLGRLTLPFDS